MAVFLKDFFPVQFSPNKEPQVMLYFRSGHGRFLHHHTISFLKVAEDGSAEGSSTDRIAMDKDMACNFLQFFCIRFGGCRKDETNTILYFLLRIKEKNILRAGANNNGKNLHFISV